MDKKQFYTKTKTIRGKEYTAQFNGLSAYLQALDGMYISDDSRNISNAKLTGYVLDNVIVDPKGLTPDSFDDYEELTEVVSFGREVMQGRFRTETAG